MEEVLLSKYLERNGFGLSEVNIVRHPVSSDSEMKFAFYAMIKAVDLSTGTEYEYLLHPRYATMDWNISFGYECDDLVLFPYADSGFGLSGFLWKYAKYGDMIVLCGDLEYDIDVHFPENKLAELFVFPCK